MVELQAIQLTSKKKRGEHALHAVGTHRIDRICRHTIKTLQFWGLNRISNYSQQSMSLDDYIFLDEKTLKTSGLFLYFVDAHDLIKEISHPNATYLAFVPYEVTLIDGKKGNIYRNVANGYGAKRVALVMGSSLTDWPYNDEIYLPIHEFGHSEYNIKHHNGKNCVMANMNRKIKYCRSCLHKAKDVERIRT
jgi:hypothetical protein